MCTAGGIIVGAKLVLDICRGRSKGKADDEISGSAWVPMVSCHGGFTHLRAQLQPVLRGRLKKVGGLTDSTDH